jgi:hypothetical protein
VTRGWNLLALVRHLVDVRRPDRFLRGHFRREISGYASASDRLDFEAILDRYPDEVTREARAVLAAPDAVTKPVLGARRAR